MGFQKKKHTLEETLSKIDERIKNLGTAFLDLLIKKIQEDAGITIKSLLSYTRISKGDKVGNRNSFLTKLGNLVKQTIFQISSSGMQNFFLGYDSKKYEMSYGVYDVPASNIHVRFLYEDGFFANEAEKHKLEQAFKDTATLYTSSSEVKLDSYSLKDIFGEELYNRIKEHLLKPESDKPKPDGTISLFFLMATMSLVSLSYKYAIERNSIISFVFCLENDNYPIWDVVRHMYKLLGIPVQTFTKNVLKKIVRKENSFKFQDFSTKKNISISLFKNSKFFSTSIKKLEGSIPKDYLNVVFVIEEKYSRVFTRKNAYYEMQNNGDSNGISHSILHLYRAVLQKDDKAPNVLKVSIQADIPLSYLHQDPNESLDVVKKKIERMIENSKKNDNVIAFISTNRDSSIGDIKTYIEIDESSNKFNKASFVLLEYFILPLPNLSSVRKLDKGYIVDNSVMKEVPLKSEFKVFERLHELIGIKPVKAISRSDDFLQSSNLHMFGFSDELGFEIKEMFVYALLGLSGYFSESSQYAYKSFDFFKKIGEKYNIARNNINYRFSFFSIIPELLYQQQKLLSNYLNKSDSP